MVTKGILYFCLIPALQWVVYRITLKGNNTLIFSNVEGKVNWNLERVIYVNQTLTKWTHDVEFLLINIKSPK